MLKGENRIMSDLLFQNLYRIPSARACWHNYGDGYYFITICTAGRECYFGEIIPDRNGINRNHLTAIGQYADAQIRNVQSHYSFCEIPLWVVMPNHIHLIVAIDGLKTPWVKRDMVGRGGPVETFHETSQQPPTPIVSPTQNATQMQSWLSVVIRQFKQSVTRFSNDHAIPFGWQSRFHDHIIRDQQEFDRIAYYITNNVARWNSDCFRR